MQGRWYLDTSRGYLSADIGHFSWIDPDFNELLNTPVDFKVSCSQIPRRAFAGIRTHDPLVESQDILSATARHCHCQVNADDPPGSRQVYKYESFTTKNRSRWISFNFVRDTFTTEFYSRLVRDRFTTRSNMFATRFDSCRERVANES
jgi:hypothetical protein